MTKSSAKKLSILGLVLIAASAVTASVLPKSKPTVEACDGKRINDLVDGNPTCTRAAVNEEKNCHLTTTQSEAPVTTGTGVGDAATTANPGSGCE